jgi:hypothetical protein
MMFEGTAHVFGRDVDTDVIIPARYLNTSDSAELGAHCMEDIDAEFVRRVQPGDVIVAGENFGCGSSREHAPVAIKAAGVSCVVRSFARDLPQRHHHRSADRRVPGAAAVGQEATARGRLAAGRRTDPGRELRPRLPAVIAADCRGGLLAYGDPRIGGGRGS